MVKMADFQEQDIEQIDPPSKVLWRTLKEKGFPADYNSFVSDMSDMNNRRLLYNKVVEKRLFTKNEKEFDSFFTDIDSKKKESTNASSPVAKQSTSLVSDGSTEFLNQHPKVKNLTLDIPKVEPQPTATTTEYKSVMDWSKPISITDVANTNPQAGNLDFQNKVTKDNITKTAAQPLTVERNAKLQGVSPTVANANLLNHIFNDKPLTKFDADFIGQNFSNLPETYQKDVAKYLSKVKLDNESQWTDLVSRVGEMGMSEKQKVELLEKATGDRFLQAKRDLDILQARQHEKDFSGKEGTTLIEHGQQVVDNYNAAKTDAIELVQRFPEVLKERKEIKSKYEGLEIKGDDSVYEKSKKVFAGQILYPIWNAIPDLVKSTISIGKGAADLVKSATGQEVSNYGRTDRMMDGISDFLDNIKGVTPREYQNDEDLKGQEKGLFTVEGFVPKVSSTLAQMYMFGMAGKTAKGNSSLASAMFGTMQQYDQYAEVAKELGLSDDKVFMYAAPMSLIQSMLENVSTLGEKALAEAKVKGMKEAALFLKDNPKGDLQKHLLNFFGQQYGEEFAQLGVEKITNLGANYLLGQDKFDTGISKNEIAETGTLTTAVNFILKGKVGKDFKNAYKETVDLFQSKPEDASNYINQLYRNNDITRQQAEDLQNIVDNGEKAPIIQKYESQTAKLEEANADTTTEDTKQEPKPTAAEAKTEAKTEAKAIIPEEKKVKEISEEELLNETPVIEVVKETVKDEPKTATAPTPELVEVKPTANPDDTAASGTIEPIQPMSVNEQPSDKTEKQVETPVSGDVAIVKTDKQNVDDRQTSRDVVGTDVANIDETPDQRTERVKQTVSKLSRVEKKAALGIINETKDAALFDVLSKKEKANVQAAVSEVLKVDKANKSTVETKASQQPVIDKTKRKSSEGGKKNTTKGVFGNTKAIKDFDPQTIEEKILQQLALGQKFRASDWGHLTGEEKRTWRQNQIADEQAQNDNSLDFNFYEEDTNVAVGAFENVTRQFRDRHEAARELKRIQEERTQQESGISEREIERAEALGRYAEERAQKNNTEPVEIDEDTYQRHSNHLNNIEELEAAAASDAEMARQHDELFNKIINDPQYKNSDGSFNFDKLHDNIENGFEPDILELGIFEDANKIAPKNETARQNADRITNIAKQSVRPIETDSSNEGGTSNRGQSEVRDEPTTTTKGQSKGVNEQKLDTQIAAKKAEVKKASEKLTERAAQRQELKNKAAKQLKKENQSDIFGQKKGDKLFDDPLSVGTKDQNVFTAFDKETQALQTTHDKAAKELSILENSRAEVQKSDKAQQALFDSKSDVTVSVTSEQKPTPSVQEQAKPQETMLTSVLNQFRTQKKSKYDRDLEKSIEEKGVQEPLELIYHVHDEKIALSDGHHRLDTAMDLGIENLPVKITISGTDAPINAISVNPIEWKGRETISPSEIEISKQETPQEPTKTDSKPTLSIQQRKIQDEINIVNKQIEQANKGVNKDRVKILEKKKAELVRRFELSKEVLQQSTKIDSPTEVDDTKLEDTLTDKKGFEFDQKEMLDKEIEQAERELTKANRDILMGANPINPRQVEALVKLGYLKFKRFLYDTGRKMSLSDFADALKVPISERLKKIYNRVTDIFNSENSAEFRDKLGFIQDFRRNYQDKNVAVKMLYEDMKRAGLEITDNINFAEMQELTVSKIANAQREVSEWFRGKTGDNLKGVQSSKDKSWVGRVNKEVGSYEEQRDFMYARHALDFNARAREIFDNRRNEEVAALDEKINALQDEYVKDPTAKLKEKITKLTQEKADLLNEPYPSKPSGMSDTDANDFINKAQSDPDKYDRMVKLADEFRKETVIKRIDLMEESGLINAETAENMRTGKRDGYVSEMPNYLPFKVKSENFEDKPTVSQGALRTKIFGIQVTDKYGKAQRYDPIVMAMTELQTTQQAAENNKALLALYEAVKQTPFGQHIKIVNTRGTYAADETGDLKETRPDGKIMVHDLLAQHAIPFRDNGKVKYIYFNPVKLSNGRLVQHPIVKALKANPSEQGAFASALMNGYRTVVNYLRLIRTSYNLGFAIDNPFRDLGEALTNISNIGDKNDTEKIRLGILKNMPKSFAYFFNPMKGNETILKEMADNFQEMREQGVMMSWRNYEGVDEVVTNFEEDIKRIEQGKGRTTKEKAQVFFKALAIISESTENMTRLAVYSSMKQNGYSPQKAAYVAKNITLNFEKKGEQTKYTNLVWMFSNAGIQGASRMVSAAKSKNFWRFGLAMTAFAMANRALLINNMDDDDEDKWIYNDLENKGRTMFYNPIDPKNPIRLPKPYSAMRIFLNLGESMADVAHGKRTATDAAFNNMTETLAGAVDPIGGAGGSMTNYVPTEILKQFVQVQSNESWSGMPILKGEGYMDKKKKEEYIRSNTNTKPIFDKAALSIYDKTGVNIQPTTLEFIWKNYGDNAVKSIADYGKIGEAIYDTATGKEINKSEVPVLKRFYHSADEKKGQVVFGILDLVKTPEAMTKEQIRYTESQLPKLQNDATINPYIIKMIVEGLNEAKDPNIKKQRDAQLRAQQEQEIQAKEAKNK